MNTPNPFSLLHQIVNWDSPGLAASTTVFVSFGMAQPFEKLTKNSP